MSGPRLAVIAHDANLGGGADRVLLDVLGELSRTGRWHPVVIFPARGTAVDEAAARSLPHHLVTSHRWAGPDRQLLPTVRRTARNLLAIPRMVALLRRERPDAILVNTLSASPSGAIAARLLGIPVAWWAHEHGTADHGLRFVIGRRLALRTINHLTHTVLGITGSVRDSLAPQVPPDEVVVTGVALRPTPPGVAVPDTVGSPLRITVIGTVTAGKRQHEVVAALDHLVHVLGLPAVLRCVGWDDNPEADRVRAYAEALGVAHLVSFDGQVADIEGVFTDTDVLVSAAVDEGLSMVVAEAMQRRRPVVVSRSGGQVELVEHDRTGLVYEPGDVHTLAGCLFQLATDDARRRRLTAAGARSMLDRHRVETTAATVADALDAMRTAARDAG